MLRSGSPVAILALLLVGNAVALDVGVLRGQLAEGSTGRPVANALVVIPCASGFAFTDNVGIYQLAGLPLSIPDCAFSVFEPSYRPVSFITDLVLPPNQAFDINPAVNVIFY